MLNEIYYLEEDGRKALQREIIDPPMILMR